MRHAYENTKYYRRLFDSVGIKPEDIRTVDNLSNIPITTREGFQQLRLDEITAEGIDIRTCRKVTTSGSSGVPLDVYFTQRDFNILELVWLRAYMEDGLKLRDKRIKIGYPHPFSNYWFQRLGIFRNERVSIFEPLRNQLAILAKGNFDALSSYASNLRLLAKEIGEQQINGISPKLIFSTSEFLDKTTRDTITSAFGDGLFNCYGAWEFGLIGWECNNHSGCHINTDCLVVEFIKNGTSAAPGQMGNIVCTNLHSYAMPFIRFDTGDVGVSIDKQCACRRTLPLMDVLIGRASDLVHMGRGRFAHPAMFDPLIEGRIEQKMKQLRIIQKSLNHFVFQVIAETRYHKAIEEHLSTGCNKLFNKPIDVEIDWVSEIPKDKTGKLRIFISEIKS